MGSNLQMIYVTKHSEVLCAKAYATDTSLYLCSNRDVLRLCENMGLNAMLLNESLLEDFEAEHNDWAYRTTIALIERLRDRSFSERDVCIETNFYTIQSVLAQGVKFIRTVEFLVCNYKPVAILWFRARQSFFVKVIREYLAIHHPDVRAVELMDATDPQMTKPSLNIKKKIRTVLSAILNVHSQLVLSLRWRRKEKLMLVSGGLNHLRAVVLLLNKEWGVNVVMVESCFNLEKYVFCLKQLIPYFVLPENKAMACILWDGNSFLGQQTIIFEGVDYTTIFDSLFEIALSSGFLRLPFQYVFLTRMYERLRPSGVLLDEDLSIRRRCLAVFAWRWGNPSFVISHGVPGQALRSELKRDRFLESSITIVNSEFERSVYANIYFDPDKVVPLGIPRYDEIISLNAFGRPAKKCLADRQTIVLLCLSGFYDYDFEAMMHVLVRADALGALNKTYVRDLFAILSGRDNTLLIIKPHYSEEEHDIIQYVTKLHPKVAYRIESHRANTFVLEKEADVILTPESSVVIECLMLKKQILIMNYTGCRGFPTPYKRIEFVPQARNFSELRENVFRALEETRIENSPFAKQEQLLSFVSKYSDGHSAERVAGFIVSHLARQHAGAEIVSREKVGV